MLSKITLLFALAAFAAVESESSVAQFLSHVSTPWYCLNNGTAHCKCPEGWTGPHCDKPEECCERRVLYDGQMTTVSLCGEHGVCIKEGNGCSCNCTDDGWHGKFCDQYDPKEIHISERCLAYPLPDKSVKTETSYRCNMSYERCIPDNINCMFNMPLAKDSDGNAYCPQEDRVECDGMCKCKDPIGWCIPLETYQNTLKVLAARPQLSTK